MIFSKAKKNHNAIAQEAAQSVIRELKKSLLLMPDYEVLTIKDRFLFANFRHHDWYMAQAVKSFVSQVTIALDGKNYIWDSIKTGRDGDYLVMVAKVQIVHGKFTISNKPLKFTISNKPLKVVE